MGGKITKADSKVTKYLGFTLLPHLGVSLVFTGIAVSMLNGIDPSLASIVSGTIVAAAIINTGDNYYLLKVQIEHNKNYEFGYKSVYRNLKNQTDVNGIAVTYGQGLNDPSDLFVYFIRLEYPEEQVIYIEAHCFENDITYILTDFIN